MLTLSIALIKSHLKHQFIKDDRFIERYSLPEHGPTPRYVFEFNIYECK